MPIRPGEPWGEPGPLPPNGVLAGGDAELRAIVEDARRRSSPIPPVGLLGGDLCRTVGGRGDKARIRTGEAIRLTVDLASVLVDGRQFWFASHLVARRGWWTGRIFAAMNAEWLDGWMAAPRSHPNDGLLDVLDADPSLTDRWRARRRLPAGSHVPHPDIRTERTKATHVAFDRPLDVWLDGECVARARSLTLRVEPDALLVVV